MIIYFTNIMLLDVFLLIILLISTFSFFVFKEFRSNKKIFGLIFLAMITRIFLIVINTFFITLPGSDVDAQRFVRNARLIITNEIEYNNIVGAAIYEHFLSWAFRIFDHLLFGIILSNIAFFIAILILLKALDILKISNPIKFIVLTILLFYPSLLFHTVGTLREPYQFLFLTIAIYFYLLLIHKSFKISYLFILSLSVILFGLLHNGLLGFVPVILIILLIGLLKYSNDINKNFIITLFGTFLLLLIILLMATGFISSNMVDAIIEGEASDYAENYREFMPEVRSSYSAIVDLSNPFNAIISISDTIIKYFTYPLPWHISSARDIVSLTENIIRLYLIYYIFKNRKVLSTLKPVLIIYFLLEVLWSLGTANWGTAARHHIVQSQLLLIVFGYVKNVIDSKKGL